MACPNPSNLLSSAPCQPTCAQTSQHASGSHLPAGIHCLDSSLWLLVLLLCSHPLRHRVQSPGTRLHAKTPSGCEMPVTRPLRAVVSLANSSWAQGEQSGCNPQALASGLPWRDARVAGGACRCMDQHEIMQACTGLWRQMLGASAAARERTKERVCSRCHAPGAVYGPARGPRATDQTFAVSCWLFHLLPLSATPLVGFKAVVKRGNMTGRRREIPYIPGVVCFSSTANEVRPKGWGRGQTRTRPAGPRSGAVLL